MELNNKNNTMPRTNGKATHNLAEKTGGRVAVAVWGSLAQNPLFEALHAALQETLPAGIDDLLKAPFSLHDDEELMSLAREAGLKNIEVKSFPCRWFLEGD